MRHNFAVYGLAACGGLAALSAQAGFDPSIVAADAQWVAYLDVDSFRTSVVGKELVAQTMKMIPENPGAQIGIQLNFEQMLASIGSATAFGTAITPDPAQMDGALIVRGTADLRKIAESIAIQANLVDPKAVAEVPGAPFPTYSIDREVFVGFPPEQAVIFSRSRAQLEKARDLLRGRGASLAQSPSLPLAKLVGNAGTSYALSATLAPAKPLFEGDTPEARIANLVKSGSFRISETVNRLSAHLTLNAPNEETATKLRKIMEGLTAMLALNAQNNNQIGEFLKASTATQEGSTVNVDISYPADRIVAMIRLAEGLAAPPPAIPTIPNGAGRVVSEWKLVGDQAMTHQRIENVELKNGSMISVYAQRTDNTSAAFLDKLEVLSGGPAGQSIMKLEAEWMTLNRYRAASLLPTGNIVLANAIQRGRGVPPGGGRMAVPEPSWISGVSLNGPLGWIQQRFQGADGTYTIDVSYRNENTGTTTMTVRIEDPR